MDYSSLRTRADIMNACRKCQNAGEQIDLFEALATSNPPPIGAFFEILKGVKFEVELALTIQAFGKITDRAIREDLKRSDKLLAILSEKVQSQQTDLIRWSAATTIENLEFDYDAVAERLTVKPKNISEKIVQSKLKKFSDRNLLDSVDYNDFLEFWIFGYSYKLREITTNYDFWALREEWESERIKGWKEEKNLEKVERLNKFSVCYDVINKLDSRGFKDTNSALARAEYMGSSTSEVDENELFELVACEEAFKQLKNQTVNSDELIAIQIHCLQSRNRKSRNIAAVNLFQISKIDISLLSKFNKYYQPNLLTAIYLIKEEFNSTNVDDYFVNNSYNKLKKIANNLKILLPTLGRNNVKNDCQSFLDSVLDQLQIMENLYDIQYKEIQDLKYKLDEQLTKIDSINSQVYESIIAYNNFRDIPSINDIEDDDDEYDLILNSYVQSLRDEISRLKGQVTKFYEWKAIQNLKSTLDQQLKQIKSINIQVYQSIIENNKFEDIPCINIEENEEYYSILNGYEQSLRDETSRLKGQVTKFYKNYKKSQLDHLDTKIENLEKKIPRMDFTFWLIFDLLIVFSGLSLFLHLNLILILFLDLILFFLISYCYYMIHSATKNLNEANRENSSKKGKLNNEEKNIVNLLLIEASKKYRLNNEEEQILNLLSIEPTLREKEIMYEEEIMFDDFDPFDAWDDRLERTFDLDIFSS